MMYLLNEVLRGCESQFAANACLNKATAGRRGVKEISPEACFFRKIMYRTRVGRRISGEEVVF
ncbi:hypothetical protein HED60_07860 [Planctomycetales bacterium ZRK34]|nr:hypothetical protein HED60_07860 [Planctomycetales bacterium ZRK34]